MTQHLPLVRSIVRRMGLAHDPDAFSAGMLGLVDAARKHSTAAPFDAYARLRILERMHGDLQRWATTAAAALDQATTEINRAFASVDRHRSIAAQPPPAMTQNGRNP